MVETDQAMQKPQAALVERDARKTRNPRLWETSDYPELSLKEGTNLTGQVRRKGCL